MGKDPSGTVLRTDDPQVGSTGNAPDRYGLVEEPKTPTHLRAAGRDLWNDSLADVEFSPQELSILEEACRTRDNVRALDAAVRQDGVMIKSSQGMRLHPAIAEARQQRRVLAQMLVTLQIPGLDDDLPNARSVRGLHGKA